MAKIKRKRGENYLFEFVIVFVVDERYVRQLREDLRYFEAMFQDNVPIDRQRLDVSLLRVMWL